jgi:hypothetical protein
VPAFEAGAGWRACRLSGRVEGNATVYWAVREGGRTVVEEPLKTRADGTVDVTARLRLEGSGPVSILVRFEGKDDILRAPAVFWSPFSPALLEVGGLSL